MTVQDLLAMLGGLAVFMFGMHTLSAALEKFAGGKLENWLEKMTSNPFKGVALGAGVTALIQSSAATTVMLVGFVNSGIMKLSALLWARISVPPRRAGYSASRVLRETV